MYLSVKSHRRFRNGGGFRRTDPDALRTCNYGALGSGKPDRNDRHVSGAEQHKQAYLHIRRHNTDNRSRRHDYTDPLRERMMKMNDPGKPVMTYAAIMNIRIEYSDENLKRGDKKIEALTQVLALAAPGISGNGGMITSVSESGIDAVFENGADKALSAAFEFFTASDGNLSSQERSRLFIGIHWGTVYLAKLSCGSFTTPVAISEDVLVARMLSASAKSYDSRIMISGAATQRIHSFENRFNCRRLGLILNGRTGKELNIYDLFDSDPTDLKYGKRRGRLVFETGVKLFLQGEYLQARAYFIEILKYNRNDKTARKYIFMCDKALSDEKPADGCKYLEVW